MKEKINKERSFSIELDSKKYLNFLSLTNKDFEGFLVEGTIGELVHATFEENIILEVVGKTGVLRIDLGSKELARSSQSSVAGKVAKSKNDFLEVKKCKN
ncbi:MAG: hypothetical protein P8Y18_11960 [Candidatus Bathyarchaeota archaeon]